MVENMLEWNIEVRLGVDYLDDKEELDRCMASKVVYTGAIDAYFDYKLGTLEYRSVYVLKQKCWICLTTRAMQRLIILMQKSPYTRIIEHKWFEFGKDENGNELPKTVISREYSSEWKPGDDPYYPVNDEKNSLLYAAI